MKKTAATKKAINGDAPPSPLKSLSMSSLPDGGTASAAVAAKQAKKKEKKAKALRQQPLKREEFPYRPVNCRFGTALGGKVTMESPESIPINAAKPVPFETKLFKGQMTICVRGAPKTETDPWAKGGRFEGKKRKVVLTIQGKFKKRLCRNEVQCGLVWKSPLTNLPWAFVLNAAENLILAFSPGATSNLSAASEPHFLNSLLAGVDGLNAAQTESDRFDMMSSITPERSEWPTAKRRMDAAKKLSERTEKDAAATASGSRSRSRSPTPSPGGGGRLVRTTSEKSKLLGDSVSSSAPQQSPTQKPAPTPLSPSATTPLEDEWGFWEPETEYTFDFYGDKVDLTRFTAYVPTLPEIQLNKYFNGQPFPFIARTKSGEVLWHFEIWHESLFDRQAHVRSLQGPSSVAPSSASSACSDSPSSFSRANSSHVLDYSTPHGTAHGSAPDFWSCAASSYPEPHTFLSDPNPRRKSRASSRQGSFHSCVTGGGGRFASPLEGGSGTPYSTSSPICLTCGTRGSIGPAPLRASLPGHECSAFGHHDPFPSHGDTAVRIPIVRAGGGGDDDGSGGADAEDEDAAAARLAEETAGGGAFSGIGPRSLRKKTKGILKYSRSLQLKDRWTTWDEHLGGPSQPRPTDSFCAALVALIGLAFFGVSVYYYRDKVYNRMKSAVVEEFPLKPMKWLITAGAVVGVLVLGFLLGNATEFIKAPYLREALTALQTGHTLPKKPMWKRLDKWDLLTVSIPLVAALPEELVFRAIMIPVTDCSSYEQIMWAALSIVCYVVHFPLMSATVLTRGYPTFLDPRFLVLIAIQAVGCSFVFVRVRSIWSSAVVNALCFACWLLFGGGLKRMRRVRILLPTVQHAGPGQEASESAYSMPSTHDETESVAQDVGGGETFRTAPSDPGGDAGVSASYPGSRCSTLHEHSLLVDSPGGVV